MPLRRRSPGSAWWCGMADFSEKLAMGRVGEGAISKWLQGRGHAVFPAYEIEVSSGKGPQLFAASGDLVLPDLLSFCSGKAQWFEAKTKTCFTWHRVSQKWVTGINVRHYDEYQEVAARTGLAVWLLFLHPKDRPSDDDISRGCPPSCPTGIFGNNLGILTGCESHRWPPIGTGGMVYWAAGNLRRFASAPGGAA